MAKYTELDDRAKKALNNMCRTLGYNFPLGDWLAALEGVVLQNLLDKLDSDSGVADTDYNTLDD